MNLPLEQRHGFFHAERLLRLVEQAAEVCHHRWDAAQPPALVVRVDN
jgi:hypothetical protein